MVNGRDCVRTDETVFFNGVDDGAEGAYKYLTHLSQAADFCLTERSKQNKHLVCNEDNDVDNGDEQSENGSRRKSSV